LETSNWRKPNQSFTVVMDLISWETASKRAHQGNNDQLLQRPHGENVSIGCLPTGAFPFMFAGTLACWNSGTSMEQLRMRHGHSRLSNCTKKTSKEEVTVTVALAIWVDRGLHSSQSKSPRLRSLTRCTTFKMLAVTKRTADKRHETSGIVSGVTCNV
jgi:hypothetical protein